jgi:hypothetical protein
MNTQNVLQGNYTKLNHVIIYNLYKTMNQFHYGPEVPREFQEVKAPTLRDNGPGWW